MNPGWETDFAVAHTACLARSFYKWTGRELLPGPFPSAAFARQLFQAPFALVSHGIEPDPVLNYGNQTALALWEMSWEELTRTPSRLTAEAPNREARARLLAQVAERGFIDDYSGVRISRTGQRFHILSATVWNLVTEDGVPCGQAAMFRQWDFI